MTPSEAPSCSPIRQAPLISAEPSRPRRRGAIAITVALVALATPSCTSKKSRISVSSPSSPKPPTSAVDTAGPIEATEATEASGTLPPTSSPPVVPVPPPYDLVWMLAPTSTQPAGIPLTDLVRVYAEDGRSSGTLADALIADLRTSAASADPATALFGAIAAAGTTDVLGFRSAQAAGIGVPAAGSGTPCGEIWGSEDATYWVNWFANKIGSGTQLPGMTSATKGLVEALAGLNPGIISVNAVEKFNSVAKVVNLATGLLSLILAVSTIDVDVVQNPDPLERTKSSRQAGRATELRWTVRIDIGALPDGNQRLICAASFVLNSLGVGLTIPANGPLPGVDLSFVGRRGFGERLNTAGSFVTLEGTELTMTSDPSGTVRTTVTGMAQQRDFPDSARPVLREFSIGVTAQVEPENLNSILNVFFDGLSFGVSPAGYGLAAGAIDIAKTLHWDMGERVGRLMDWQNGWKIDQFEFDNHFTGTVCNLDQPFAVDFASPLGGWAGTFTVTPTPDGTATWAFDGSTSGTIPFVGTGSGRVETPQNAESVVVIQTSSDWVADVPDVGPRAIDIAAALALPTVTLLLQPLDTDECVAG